MLTTFNEREEIQPMQPTNHLPIDIQKTVDTRGIAITQVGVRGVRMPLIFEDNQQEIHSIALLSMTVGLCATEKGTHMSRFIEAWQANGGRFNLGTFSLFLADLQLRLNADNAFMEMHFPYFMNKQAPVTGAVSIADFEVTIKASRLAKKDELNVTIMVPVTSLCPCSKAISRYGAHSQRSYITVSIELNQPIVLADIIVLLEQAGSSQLYPLLKRPDEKYVTEHAYENPKFVEDLVRDVAIALQKETRITHFVVESENFESIHNHQAYARIESTY